MKAYLKFAAGTLLCIYIGFMLIALIHESGHALAAAYCNEPIICIQIGCGPKLFSIGPYDFCLWMIGGNTALNWHVIDSEHLLFIELAGSLMVCLVMILVCFLSMFMSGKKQAFLYAFAVQMAFMILSDLNPAGYSDGLLIASLISLKHVNLISTFLFAADFGLLCLYLSTIFKHFCPVPVSFHNRMQPETER